MGEAISGQTRDRFNGDLAGNTCGFFHPTWIIPLDGKKITVGSPLSEGGVIHGYPTPIGSGWCW